MAYSQIPRRQINKKKIDKKLLDFDCISILKQLNIVLPTYNNDELLSKKASFLSQLLKIEDQAQYEKLLSSTDAWLFKYFDAESKDNTNNEDALFVHTLLHLIVKKHDSKLILSKFSESISYVHSVDKRPLLFLLRAYVLINNQTIENLTFAKEDTEWLLKQNCNPIILEHVKKIQKILNASSFINKKESADNERARIAETNLKQMQEDVNNKNYIAAYQRGDNFFLSDDFSSDDLKKPEELYSLHLLIMIYFYSILDSNKNHELILKLKNLNITKNGLQETILTMLDTYIEASREQHILWPKLINSITSVFINEQDPGSALNALNLIRMYYDDLVQDAPELNSVINIALFQKKTNELKEKTTSKTEIIRAPLSFGLLNQIKLLNLNKEPFSSIQSGLESKYLEYRNTSLILLEKFNQATSNKDYVELLSESRNILIHFDKNQSKDDAFDIAFYIFILCHLALNTRVLSVVLAEGIDYCVNDEIKYILILIQSFQNLITKEYGDYNKNISLLHDQEHWKINIKKYQAILQTTVSFYEDHHQKNVKETAKENVFASEVIPLGTNGTLELLHKKLSEGKYINAYELAKSFTKEMTEDDSRYYSLYQIYLSKIYLAFCYDQTLRSKVRLAQTTCFNNLLRTIQDALKSSTNKHNAWEQLINYAISDNKDNKKSFYFMSFLNKAFNHISIYQSYYCVTAEGLIKRTFNTFKQKYENDIDESKKLAREETLKNKKITQDALQLQKQYRKNANKVAHQERIKNKSERMLEELPSMPQIESKNTLDENKSDAQVKKNASKQKRKREKRKLVREKMAEYRKNQSEGETQLLAKEEQAKGEQSLVIKTPDTELKASIECVELEPLVSLISSSIAEDDYQNKPTPAQIAEQRLRNKEMKRNAHNVTFLLHDNIRFEHLTKLFETNKLLRGCNTNLTFTGSFITKMGVLLYHANPETSKKIFCKDIDAYVSTKTLAEFKEVINILNQAGFIQKTPIEVIHSQIGIKINPFVKFELIFQDLKFDITVRSPSYQTYEYIPITSGQAVFSEQGNLDNKDNLILFDDPKNKTSFSLSILPTKEFKESCIHLNFSLLEPNFLTTLYFFRIFKLFKSLGDLIEIKNIDEILRVAEIYFIYEERINNYSKKIKSVYYDLKEFFNNQVVLDPNARRYIQLLCKVLLSRNMSDIQLNTVAPETLLFPILVKLYQANVFRHDIQKFRSQIDTLIKNFVFEYRLTSDAHSLVKQNNNEFINKMVILLNRIANDPYCSDATPLIIFTQNTLSSKPNTSHGSMSLGNKTS